MIATKPASVTAARIGRVEFEAGTEILAVGPNTWSVEGCHIDGVWCPNGVLLTSAELIDAADNAGDEALLDILDPAA